MDREIEEALAWADGYTWGEVGVHGRALAAAYRRLLAENEKLEKEREEYRLISMGSMKKAVDRAEKAEAALAVVSAALSACCEELKMEIPGNHHYGLPCDCGPCSMLTKLAALKGVQP